MLRNTRAALFQLQGKALMVPFPDPVKDFEVSKLSDSRSSSTLPCVLLCSCFLPEGRS